MSIFNKIYTQIIIENKLLQIQLVDLNPKNQQQLNLFLKGVNLAATASNNDLWDTEVFKITSDFSPERKWYFLKINDSFIGTLSSHIIKNVMFLSCFAIFQEFQGLGLGYQAMQAIIKYMQNNYPDLKIQLNVAKINKKAQNLYKKCAFKKIKTLPTKFVLQFN